MMVKTNKGKTLDMHKLFLANQHVPAVGSAGVNARGDKIGYGGKILKTREQIDAEIFAYHRENPSAAKAAGLTAEAEAAIQTPAEAVMNALKSNSTPAAVAPALFAETAQIAPPVAPINAKTRKISDAE